MDSSLCFTRSTPPSQPHHTEPVMTSASWGPPVYMGFSFLSPTALVWPHSLSPDPSCWPPNHLLDSPSIFKQAKFSFSKFFPFPYMRKNTNSSWPSLMWFRHICPASFSSLFPFLFAPVFLGSTGLFAQRRHYMLSFLSLPVRFSIRPLCFLKSNLIYVLCVCVYVYTYTYIYIFSLYMLLRALKLHICFDPVIQFWKIFFKEIVWKKKVINIKLPILAFT